MKKFITLFSILTILSATSAIACEKHQKQAEEQQTTDQLEKEQTEAKS